MCTWGVCCICACVIVCQCVAVCACRHVQTSRKHGHSGISFRGARHDHEAACRCTTSTSWMYRCKNMLTSCTVPYTSRVAVTVSAQAVVVCVSALPDPVLVTFFFVWDKAALHKTLGACFVCFLLEMKTQPLSSFCRVSSFMCEVLIYASGRISAQMSLA